MSTTCATAPTGGKMVLLTGDKGGCAPKGWCRPSMCQWQHICPAWKVTAQLSNSSVCTYCCPSKYPMAHLQQEQVESLVKWGFKVWTNTAVLGTECYQQDGCWAPLVGSVCQGTVTKAGTSFLLLPLPFPLLKPHPGTFTSFRCRNMFHSDKLTYLKRSRIFHCCAAMT